MAKIIKVVTLMSQQLLISEIEEVAAVVPGEPDCKLINPFVINTESGQTVLEPFLTSVTRDTTFMMGSDKIITLAEPSPTILEKYLDLLE